eukprot:3847443-Amphidinium_carterae.1
MAELAEKLLGSMDLETAQFNSANEGIRGRHVIAAQNRSWDSMLSEFNHCKRVVFTVGANTH